MFGINNLESPADFCQWLHVKDPTIRLELLVYNLEYLADYVNCYLGQQFAWSYFFTILNFWQIMSMVTGKEQHFAWNYLFTILNIWQTMSMVTGKGQQFACCFLGAFNSRGRSYFELRRICHESPAVKKHCEVDEHCQLWIDTVWFQYLDKLQSSSLII